MDFKPGGKYLHCMLAPDGKEFWSTGVFKEIIHEKKIVCTDCFSDAKGNVIAAKDLGMPGNWPLELLITVSFETDGERSKLLIIQQGVPEEMYDDCITGWQQSLDKIEKIS